MDRNKHPRNLPNLPSLSPKQWQIPLSESRRALGAEELLGVVLRDAVGEGELEVLDEELLDVRPLDVLGLLELDDAENLRRVSAGSSIVPGGACLTWMFLKRARWRAAMSE